MLGASCGRLSACLLPAIRFRSVNPGTKSCFCGSGSVTFTTKDAVPDFHLSFSAHTAAMTASPGVFAITVLSSTNATVALLVLYCMLGASCGRLSACLLPAIRFRSVNPGTKSCFCGSGSVTFTTKDAVPDFHLSFSAHTAAMTASPGVFAITVLSSTNATVALLVLYCMLGASCGRLSACLLPAIRFRSVNSGTKSCFRGKDSVTVTTNEAVPDFHFSVSPHVAAIVASPGVFAITVLSSTNATVALLVLYFMLGASSGRLSACLLPAIRFRSVNSGMKSCF